MKNFTSGVLVSALAGLSVMGCGGVGGHEGGTGDGDGKDPATAQQAATYTPQAVANNTSKRIFVHVMPWFDAKNTQHGYIRPGLSAPYTPTVGSGTPPNSFGPHWTMNNCKAETNGLLNRICAVDAPLIGPYSSSDPYVIEYHLLLIKYAGADGISIDWPGVTRLYDYPGNRYNAERYIERLGDFGLNFMIIMEDRNYQDGVQNGLYGDVTDGARNDLSCLKAGGTCGNTYFGHGQYEKLNNIPVVGVFGPISLQSGGQWATAYSGAGLGAGSTYHIGLWNENGELGDYNDGSFSWIWQDAEPHYLHQQRYLDNHPYGSIKMASVYPSFDPYYSRGGWGSDVTTQSIPSNGGATVAQLFDIALASNANYVQLNTWNDFGEDTVFEPTVGDGFSVLETMQHKLGVSYNKSQLELVKKLFDERVSARKAGDSDRQSQLDQASAYLAALNVSDAEGIINGVAPPPPSGGTRSPFLSVGIPGTIQAENFDNGGQGVAFHDTSTPNDGGAYRTTSGDSVDIEVTGDAGGGYDVGWINTGEWLEYTFTSSTTRNYDFRVRVASPQSSGRISLAIDGTLIGGIKDVPNTGDWQSYTDLTIATGKQVVSGTHVLRVNVDSGGFNVNYVTATATATGAVCGNSTCELGESCSACPSDCGQCSVQSPHGGTPANLPGLLAMDRFDNGGEGVAYHDDGTKNGDGLRPDTHVDLEDHNGTGTNIGWNNAGEWLEWTVNVVEAGSYDMHIQSAGFGGTFKFTLTGATSYDSGPLDAVPTGQWQEYQTVAKNGFTLNAGIHVVRLECLANVAFNLKNLELLKTGTPLPPLQPPPNTQWPYGSTQQLAQPALIPGTIQAENFDEGGPGIAYYDTTTANQGNSTYRPSTQVDLCYHGNQDTKICYGDPGEWTEYTVNVSQTATYDLTTRYTNGCSNNATWQLQIDNKVIGDFTGTFVVNDWGSFREATLQDVPLQAGYHVLKYLNSTGCHDVDWFKFVIDPSQPPPPAPSGPTLTRTLKNVAAGKYAYRDGATVKYTSNPDAYGASAQWAIEDYAGYKRLRNLGNNCLAHIQDLLSYVQCDTTTFDTWYSNRWTVTMVGSTYVFSNAWQSTELNLFGLPAAGVQCTERGTNTDAQWIYTP